MLASSSLVYSACLARQWTYLLLLLGLLLSWNVAAQALTPRQAALRRYWNADPDSLRQVLASQHTDTARLRTLRHLADLDLEESGQWLPELARLTGRLHTADHRAYHLWRVADSLATANPPRYPAAIASLQAAITELDRLHRSALAPLVTLNTYYTLPSLKQAKRVYYQAKLAEYHQRGDSLNEAGCSRALGGYYERRGEYNRAIGCSLQAARPLRLLYPLLYRNELMSVGVLYVLWGNYERGLVYLRRVAAASEAAGKDPWYLAGFANRYIAQVYLQQQRPDLALQYINRVLVAHPFASPSASSNQQVNRALSLAVKSAALLAQGRVSTAGQVLLRAQHLADSLRLEATGWGSELGILTMTRARYDAATNHYAQAEAGWLAAYRHAQVFHSAPLRLTYLRELGRFYQQRGQLARAAPYALAAVTLADSLDRLQGAGHVAQYETEQADRAQQARLASLRLAQVQEVARARRQRLLLGATLLVLALVASLGYVLWRGSRRRQRANEALSRLNAEVTTQRDQTAQALTELQATQRQLIQKEKMASLGELTAGIAHEIQNPLNFVTNFSDVSAELVTELNEALATDDKEEAVALATDLRQNLTKIHQHGQRAAGIVRGMLEHSRQSTGERQPTNLNQLADEYLRLAYHGLRAKDQSFNAELQADLAPDLPRVEGVAGDLGRVLLNLFTNAFYAVQQRQQAGETGYVPVVSVHTQQVGQQVQLQVQDNGTGMSPEVQAKIFQPFFTTKPTGEGTGLGLSLSYDIVTEGHGGTLVTESQPGQGSTFTVRLPMHPESPSVPG